MPHSLWHVREVLKKYEFGRWLKLCGAKQKLMLLPGVTKLDDVIAAFRGASFPYVLRRLSRDDDTSEQ